MGALRLARARRRARPHLSTMRWSSASSAPLCALSAPPRPL